MKPLLSVVIANYNYGRFLEEAIRSVISQRPRELIELIICDGGSNDGSVDIIKRYSSEIVWWCSEKDSGQSNAFNKGFAHARGRFLTWLNADDILLPGSLAKLQIESNRHKDCEWFVGGSIWCDRYLFMRSFFRPHKFSQRRVKERQLTVAGPSSFFSRELYEKAGRIDESLHYVMDCDLWYRFVLDCGASYRSLNAYTWAFRFHSASKTNGRVATPSDEMSQRNAEKFARESLEYKVKFGPPNGVYKYTWRIPTSIFDAIHARFDRFRFGGRHINAMFKTIAADVKILLSNPIQEYVTGLTACSKMIYSFRTDFYRKQVESIGNVRILDPEEYPTIQSRSEYIIRNGINVLYAQGAGALVEMVKIRRFCEKCKPKLIVTCHSPQLWGNFFKALMFVLYAALFADGMVFLVERYRRKWRLITRMFHFSTWHVCNPVDVSRFLPFRYGKVDKTMITLGCIGTINPRKRQDILIDMLKYLKNDGCLVKLRLAGNCTNEGYRQKLVEKVSSNQLSDYVVFDGRIAYDAVPQWFSKIDIYICPSDDEVQPFSILEAMAMKIPVIAHDIAGIHEEVKNGVNGILIRSSDPQDYALAVKHCMDTQVRKDMGEAGAEYVSTTFSMEEFCRKMTNVVCSL